VVAIVAGIVGVVTAKSAGLRLSALALAVAGALWIVWELGFISDLLSRLTALLPAPRRGGG